MLLIPLLLTLALSAREGSRPVEPAPRDTGTGAIEIAVVDDTGARYPGIVVVLDKDSEKSALESKDPRSKTPRSEDREQAKDHEDPAILKKVTDATGKVTFDSVAPGTYRVRIETEGYRVSGDRDVTIEAGKAIYRSYTL